MLKYILTIYLLNNQRVYWIMNLTQYVTTLFCVLWNIIVFLCSIFAPQNSTNGKKPSFSTFAHIDIYFYNIFLLLKELKKKIIINKNNQADTTSAQIFNNNKKQTLNKFNANNKALNQSLKTTKLLSYLRLKDAQATQNLISKHHFSRLGDKCAFLYPFLSKNHCSQYIF